MCICIQIKKKYIIFIYFTWCNYIKRTGLTIEYIHVHCPRKDMHIDVLFLQKLKKKSVEPLFVNIRVTNTNLMQV